MRWLLSLLLSCCFFTSPVESKAGDVSTHHFKKQDDKKQSGIVQYLLSDQHVALLSNNNNNNPGTGYKTSSPANFINAFHNACCNAVCVSQHQIIPSYLYCKSIGLKLIFPKHYFW